jgi:hypothetical protein
MFNTYEGGRKMAKRNNTQNQPNSGGNQAKASDTEFGAELGLSKKARKKAARELKNNK